MSESPLYLHIRVMLSLILGLAITTLLKGMVSFVQHPGKRQWSAIHLGWSLWALLNCVLVWWWEFELRRVQRWSFGAYAYELLYCSLYYVLAAFRYPKEIAEYDGYADYILSRRGWLFGLVGLITAVDVGDSLVKGLEYFRNLGTIEVLHVTAMTAIAAVGATSASRPVQRVLVSVALLSQIWYTVAQYAELAD
jgi:hypothetical protein